MTIISPSMNIYELQNYMHSTKNPIMNSWEAEVMCRVLLTKYTGQTFEQLTEQDWQWAEEQVAIVLTKYEERRAVFGKAVASARDSTIRNFDAYFEGKFRGVYAEFIQQLYNNLRDNPAQAIHELLPCVVDEAYVILLQELDSLYDEGQVDITIKDADGNHSLFEATILEHLQSEYLAEDGWVAKYSKERRVSQN